MIERLYDLYSKAPDNPSVTPTERFVTEALVGVLKSDNKIKAKFFNEFLKINIRDAKIDTEAYYPDDSSFIDIRIKSDTKLIFIEVKVDSGEGIKQLQKYDKLLNKLEKQNDYSETHLIYLTRDYVDSPNYFSTEPPKHIYWSQVAKFFNDYKENALINAYLKFLDNLRLGPMKTLSTNDLKSLENYQDLYEKIYGIKAVMESKFKERYGKPSFWHNAEQILEKGRIILIKKPVLEGGGWSELGLGLYFSQPPQIRTNIYVNKSNEFCDILRSCLKSNFSKKDYKIYPDGVGIDFQRDLEELVGDDSPQDKLIIIIKELFDNIDQVFHKTSDLDWLIYNKLNSEN